MKSQLPQTVFTKNKQQFPQINIHSSSLSVFQFLSLAAVIALSATSAQAASQTWKNTGSDWNTAANWVGGAVPGQTGSVQGGPDTVTFPSALTVVNPSLSAAEWTVNSLIIDNTQSDYSIATTATTNILSLSGGGINLLAGGTTTINPVVRLVNGQGWATGATAFTLANGLQVNTSSALTLTNSVAVQVNGTVQGFTTAITGNANSPSASASQVVLSGGGSMVINGVVQNNGLGTSTTGISTQTSFSGTLTLNNAANSFSGSVDIAGGTLAIGANAPSGANGALGNSTASLAVGQTNITGGSANLLTTGAYTVGRNILVRSLGTGTQTVTIGGSQTTGTSTYSGTIGLNTRTVTLSAASGGQVDFTGVISTTGGSSGITASGGGTVRLAAANTYIGGTTVNAGTILLVDNSTGSGTGTGNVVVASGATLGGVGTVKPGTGNSITLNGVLSPGTSGSIGTLTFDGGTTAATLATFASGSSFAFNLTAGVGSDKVALLNGAAGDFAFNNNNIAFTLSGTLSSGQAYTLFTGGVANAFSGLTYSGSVVTGGLTFSGLGGAFQTNSYISLVGNDLVLNVVPEPSSLALLGLGVLAIGGGLRLRRMRTGSATE